MLRREFAVPSRARMGAERSRPSSSGWTTARSGELSQLNLGDWHHAYLRFRRWTVAGVWDRILAHLSSEADPDLGFACCIDGTIARAHQKASGARQSKLTNK